MKKIISAIAVLTLLVSCTPENNPDVVGGGNNKTWSIHGFVQKGPFVQGSTITIQALDSLSLSPTGQSYSTITTNDLGSFSLDSQIPTRYVETTASGYYYNEVEGKISQSTITLRAISDLKEGGSSNVNILTTLEAGLVRKLIMEGLSIADARIEADRSILSCFGIRYNSNEGFDKMDVTGQKDRDAILLAISIILQAGRAEGEFSEYYSKLAQTVSEGKSFTIDSNYRDYIDVVTIRQNMEGRFGSAPSFEGYLDMDGDGILDMIHLSIPESVDNVYRVNSEAGIHELFIDSSIDFMVETEQADWIEWIDVPEESGRPESIKFRVQDNGSTSGRQVSFSLTTDIGLGLQGIVLQEPDYNALLTITPETPDNQFEFVGGFRHIALKGVFSHNQLGTICSKLSYNNYLVTLDLSELETEDDVFGKNNEYFIGLGSIEDLSLPNVKTIESQVLVESALLKNLSWGERIEVITIPELPKGNGAGFLDGSWRPEELSLPGNVKSLGINAFTRWIWLKTITVKSDWTLGTSVFSHSGLETVIFEGKDELTIPEKAFYNATALTTVVFPESLKTLVVENEAFMKTTSLTSLLLPASLTSLTINDYAFSNSSVPLELNLRAGIDYSIQEHAFNDCPNVWAFTDWNPNSFAYPCPNIRCYVSQSTLNVPETADDYFSNCSIFEFILSDATQYLVRAGTFATSVTNTSKLLSISEGAFSGNTRITTFDWPSALNKVPNECFQGCTSLTTITGIPSTGFRVIGHRAFKGTAISDISEFLNETISIGRDAFYCCPNITSVTIPASVPHINPYTFFGCTSLSNVVFEGPINAVLHSSFAFCNLTDVSFLSKVLDELVLSALDGFKGDTLIIPDGVKHILQIADPLGDGQYYPDEYGTYTFLKHYYHTVVIPGTIKLDETHGLIDLVFHGDVKEVILNTGFCDGIISIQIEGVESLHLPKDVKNIQRILLWGQSTKLKDLYIPASVPPTANTNALNNLSNPNIHIPIGSLKAYQSHDFWQKFAGLFIEDLPSED